MFEFEIEENDIERIPLGIGTLDEKISGGIPSGHIVLVCGSAGSMKSSITYSILFNLAKNYGRKVVYITLEQSKESILKHMKGLGFDNTNSEQVRKNLAIVDLGHLRKEIKDIENVDWMKSLIDQIKKYKMTYGFDVVAIDSMEALYVLAEMKNPRNQLFTFFENLRDLDLTSFLITEMKRGTMEIGTYGIEDFLADGVIHLDVRKDDDTVNRYVGVIKMRATKHDMDYYPLLIEDGGFEIVTR